MAASPVCDVIGGGVVSSIGVCIAGGVSNTIGGTAGTVGGGAPICTVCGSCCVTGPGDNSPAVADSAAPEVSGVLATAAAVTVAVGANVAGGDDTVTAGAGAGVPVGAEIGAGARPLGGVAEVPVGGRTLPTSEFVMDSLSPLHTWEGLIAMADGESTIVDGTPLLGGLTFPNVVCGEFSNNKFDWLVCWVGSTNLLNNSTCR